MRRSTFLFGLLLVILLGGMAAAPMLVRPPAPRLRNQPVAFDATRAKARLAFILGREAPHPADSAANDEVRARLVSVLRQIGANPIVRDQLACNELLKQRGLSCARVRNVIAVLGPANGNGLLLNSHYDSVAAGPGASDDGMGIATMLEVGSILKSRPLHRPVILLFNEGEELGLVGARAFLADPLSNRVDGLINLEARGVTGPVNMFETSRPNAAAIDTFAAVVKRPSANSLSTYVYRLMPNYTDVSSFSERRWLTFNLAPVGNETRYHSSGDDLAALDPATLQHMGDQTLALAESLADRAPAAKDQDRVYMDMSGRLLINFPVTSGILLLLLLLAVFAGTTFRNGEFGRSAAVVLGTVAGSTIFAAAAESLLGAARHGMFWRARPLWIHLAIYATVLVVGTFLIATIGRRASSRQLRSGFWLLFLCVGALIGSVAPGALVYFLFPPLLVASGMLIGRWWRPAEPIASGAAILFLYLSWGAMLALLEEAINDGPMWIFALIGSLLLLPVLIEAKPLVDGAGRRAATATAGLLMIAGWTAAAAVPAYSEDRQQPFVIQHVTDAEGAKSWWSVLNDGAPLPASFGAGWTRGRLPVGAISRWLRSAPPDPASKAPAVRLLSQVQNGNERTLLLGLTANGNDEIELIAPEDSQISSAGVTGFVRPIREDQSGKYFISCSGRSCDGMRLELTTSQLRPIRFLVVGTRYQLPPSATPLVASRPRFARPQYNPDASIAFASVNL